MGTDAETHSQILDGESKFELSTKPSPLSPGTNTGGKSIRPRRDEGHEETKAFSVV